MQKIVGNSFNDSTDGGCYKPITTTNSFDNKNNYIECESKGDKDKDLWPKEYLDMIKPYLSNMINNHKAQEVWKVYSGNEVIDNKTPGEWKIQLTI